MILQALVNYYEQLALRGEISKPGWQEAKVSFALNLSGDGGLLNVLPLKTEDRQEKRTVERLPKIQVPVQEKKASGIASNFLCENAAYLLGLDAKGKPERTKKCFAACRERHLALLDGVDGPEAEAICAFFRTWNPEEAAGHPAVEPYLEDLKAGGNLVFRIGERYAQDVPAIAAAWDAACAASDGPVMQCLVTGERAPVARLHAAVKGVPGAQPTGASIVSFNAPAYESYGHDDEQGLNAPVSEYAAFAYTTALNRLLGDRDHRLLLGDAVVVFWAEDADPVYTDIFALSMDPQEEGQKTLRDILTKLSDRRPVAEGVDVKVPFYVLGLSPNAARLSIRFFLRDSFGGFLENIRRHYERLEIVKAGFEPEYLSPYWMLRETVHSASSDKAASPVMAGAVLRAVLTGAPYPAALYVNTMLRVRAERSVTRGKAAILKACLLTRPHNDSYKEVLTVALNEQSDYTPYVLGRAFSLLENIQESAGGATTVKDRYFNSACATPGTVFPLLLRLKNSHMRVLKREKAGLAVTLERELGGLLNQIDEFPKRLSLEEQGAFLLGYYHQTQKRYEKKEDKSHV